MHGTTVRKKKRKLYFIVFLIQGSLSSLMMATYVVPKHVAVFTCKIKLCTGCDPNGFSTRITIRFLVHMATIYYRVSYSLPNPAFL